MRNVIGTMPGADLIRAITALWRALTKNDEQAINRIALPLGVLVSMQNSLDAFLAVEKHLLVRQGALAFTLWLGRAAPEAVMTEAVAKARGGAAR